MTLALYDEMLSHHGIEVGRRHARKHLGWALDTAATAAGAPAHLLKHHRDRTLTAESRDETARLVAAAFDAFAADTRGKAA